MNDSRGVGPWRMAATLLRIGATSYGGPAIVAQIRRVTVIEQGWITDEEFRESLAFAQMLPGPVATQTAAHVGWRLHRGRGVLLAMLAYNSPAFLLMLGLSAAYFRFAGLPLVHAAFRGLEAAVVAIVVQSILAMAQPALRDWRGVVIAALAAWGFFGGANTLLVLAGAAVAGIAAGALRPRRPPAGGDGAGLPAPRPGTPYRRTLLAAAAVALAYAAAIAASGAVSPRLPALGAAMTRINLVAFGGGYTAVAFMFQEAVHDASHAWLTTGEFLDGLALGQITPGPVIVTATFIGYKVGGVVGAAFAPVCIFLPSSLLLVVLAPQFARLRHLAVVQGAVGGLLAAFVAMLLHVLAEVARSALVGPWETALAVAALVALRLRVGVIWVVVAATAVGLAVVR